MVVKGKIPVLILTFVSLGIDFLMIVIQAVKNSNYNLFKGSIWLLPAVLLLLYVFKFHQGKPASVIVSTIFAALAILRVGNAISALKAGVIFSGLTNLLIIAVLVVTALAIVKGWGCAKVFMIVATGLIIGTTAISLAEHFLQLLENLQAYIEYGVIGDFLLMIVSEFGSIAFHIALLFVGIFNKIPALFKAKH